MKEQIRKYIIDITDKYGNDLTVEDLRNELIANSLDRFDGYIKDGMATEDAYRKVISLIGDLDSIFDKKGTDLIDANAHFFIPMILITIINILTISLMDTLFGSLILISNIIIVFLASAYYISTISKVNKTNYSEKYISRIKVIIYVSSLSITLSLFKLFSPFLASTTFYKHIAEYIVVGVLISYIINRITITILYSSNVYKQTSSNKLLGSILITIGIAIFTIPNYFKSLRSENFYLIGLTATSLYVLLILSAVTKIKKKKRNISILNILLIVVILKYIIDLWLVIIGVVGRDSIPISFQPLVILIMLVWVIYLSIKALMKKITFERFWAHFLETFKIIFIVQFTWIIPFEIGFIMDFPSLIASTPHHIKLSLTTLLIRVWAIELVGLIDLKKFSKFITI